MNDFYCDEVLSGRLPVQTVLETEDVIAFHHTRPTYEHHIVVVPKEHVPSFVDLGSVDEDLLNAVIRDVRIVAGLIVDEHGACRVITNLGDYQESKHLHFHVVAGERRTG